MTTAAQKTACVEIGKIPIALSTSDPDFLESLRQRYAGFLSSSHPEFELEFELLRPGWASDDDVRVRREGDDWIIRRGDFSARLDPPLWSGHGAPERKSVLARFASCANYLHSLILADHSRFLLHSASAVLDGKAYLFRHFQRSWQDHDHAPRPCRCHTAGLTNFVHSPG